MVPYGIELEIAYVAMKKVLIFQHSNHDIDGALSPYVIGDIKVDYINFSHSADARPLVSRYDSLVVMGGPMNVMDFEKFPHLRFELSAIEEALRLDIPVLGVCLGGQMLAHILGGSVKRDTNAEIGWQKVNFVSNPDTVFSEFGASETLFQCHADSFEVPRCAQPVASSAVCPGQAFAFGEKAFGMQFHIEVNEFIIRRWLALGGTAERITRLGMSEESVIRDTLTYGAHSQMLARSMFGKFLNLVPGKTSSYSDLHQEA